MTNPPTCLRCNVEMEIGFALDNTHGGQLTQTWVGGEIEPIRWLGIKTGSVEVKDRVKATFIAYRCPACYRVEWFAPPIDDHNQLLRPAGVGTIDSTELLRPADISELELESGNQVENEVPSVHIQSS